MASIGRTIPARYCRKKCLGCGYDGRGLQDGHVAPTWLCPHCGADLYSRPPRSYAEMEGLADEPSGASRPRGNAAPGMTLGFRSIAHLDRRRVLVSTPSLKRGAPSRILRRLTLFVGALLTVVLAATVVSIGVWLPGQF